jgi:hypothetical protein
MEVDEPKGRPAERDTVYEMADEPREEALTELADEARRLSAGTQSAGAPAHDPAPATPHPHPRLPSPEPLQREEADEPRKLP